MSASLARAADDEGVEEVIAVVRAMIFEGGGVSEAEAGVLLVVLDRLEAMAATDGAEAALKAAREIKAMWVAEGRGGPVH